MIQAECAYLNTEYKGLMLRRSCEQALHGLH